MLCVLKKSSQKFKKSNPRIYMYKLIERYQKKKYIYIKFYTFHISCCERNDDLPFGLLRLFIKLDFSSLHITVVVVVY